MTSKTDPPESLDDKEKERVKEWCKTNYPHKFRFLGNLWNECVDWHLSNGVKRVNWEATFRNWVRRSAEFEADKRRREKDPYWNETPQESRDDSERNLVPIADIITGGKK